MTLTTSPPAVPAAPTASPSLSQGHEHAEAPLDPEVALPASGFYAHIEPSPASLPAGVLTDQTGAPFDLGDATRGVDVALVYFGYTSCPDLWFEPGVYHVMLLELPEPLEVGSTISVTLQFEQAGEITVDAEIREFVEGEGGMGETDEGM